MEPPFKITHKTQTILFACGFYSLDRAQKWIEAFDPQMYDDKTLRREDLQIEEENFGRGLAPGVSTMETGHKAYIEGRHAWRSGASQDDNPYHEIDDWTPYTAWRLGFFDAKGEGVSRLAKKYQDFRRSSGGTIPASA